MRSAPQKIKQAGCLGFKAAHHLASLTTRLKSTPCARRPRRRGPHQARFWFDGVEMPSSGRPGASPAAACVERAGPNWQLVITSVCCHPIWYRSRSRASLGWADGGVCPYAKLSQAQLDSSKVPLWSGAS